MAPTLPPCSDEEHSALSPLSGDDVARIAKGLAHPARVRIVERFVSNEPRMAHDIAAECDLAQSTVSEHLRILRSAGILVVRKDGRKRWYYLRRCVLRQFEEALEDVRLSAGMEETASLAAG